MKKIAILLAALLVLGMLAGCNAEEEKVPAQAVGGYDINIYDEGWETVADTSYDLQMVKDGINMYVIGFNSMDFVDIPPAEELYVDANEDLLEDKSVVVTSEAETSYEKNGHKYISTLFSAKDGETNMQYYSFMISFDDEAGSMAWVCFSATPKVMEKNKADLKKMVEDMDANGEYKSPEELEAELQEAMGEEFYEEDGEEVHEEIIVDEEPVVSTEEIPDDTEAVEEETEPAEGEKTEEETEPAEGEKAEEETEAAEGEATEETVTAETTPAAEATEAATETTE